MLIAEEVLSAKEEEEYIHLGDYFDKKKPTPMEIEFGTWYAKALKDKFKKVTILRGNHDTTGKNEVSAIDYLRYLGINIVDEYVDEWNNLYGHFFTDQSMYEYGTHTHTISELRKNYNYTLLGHQHNSQVLDDWIYHLGSSRYVNFNEVTDHHKQLAFIYSPERLFFSPLQTPIKMYDVNEISELSNINQNSKVRLVISSFDQFKREVNEINKWKNKFVDFKIKMDFQQEINKEEVEMPKEKKSLELIIDEELEKIEDKEVKELLKAQFKENNK